MSDIKWIKINTDMFENDKIDFIVTLPESDAIIIIWIRLLALAGRSNAGGYIMLTESIPYTEDMLANKFKKSLNTVKLALETFRRLGMISLDGDAMYVTNWEKHQNVESMERVKEYERLRKAKQRASKKLPILQELDLSGTVPQNVPDSPANVRSLDIDLDKDIDKEKDIKDYAPEGASPKQEYAPNVKLTSDEYRKLTEALGDELEDYFLRFGSWISGQTKRVQNSRSAYLTILNWHREDQKKRGGNRGVAGKGSENLNAGINFGF
ncbi:phage replisome organizer N-terminal domain-containing protein [Paenibacillus filicis]|uniref:Phage replisome organizer N-terminal domain-containing protein n=1 Tax=Paenibacillus filicis TaxID=669464 RepID=A0ABU9DW82_9BACL